MSKTIMSRSAQPPSPQEVTRKLSLHSATKPKISSVSGTESESDSVFASDIISPPTGGPTASALPGSSSQAPLSAIAERRSGSGEESEDDEEEEEGGWRTSDVKGKARGSTEETVTKAGYLWKKGERRKTWKRRWFVLRPAHLAYYKTSAEYKLLRLLDLGEVHACTPVSLKKHANTFGLVSPARTYYLQAETQHEVQEWVEAISDARQTLLSTSTQNSAHSNSQTSTPIPIPRARETSHYPPPVTPSPPSHSALAHGLTSSESEDGASNAPRSYPPISPIRATFPPSPKAPFSATADPTKMVASGYLLKCGSKRRNWRKRWFVLTGEKLSYSGSHMEAKAHRQIALSQILDALEYDLPPHRGITPHTHASPPVVSPPPVQHPGSDELDDSHKKHTFKIVTTKRTLLLCAPSEEEEIRWLSAVRALIARRSGAGVVPGNGIITFSKSPNTAVGADGHSGHGATGSTSGGIKGIARRLSVSGGSSGFSGNAVSEEGA
ncbi:hypothetical protein JAAARDRAFT_178587 [Jaapia argillacea MUCL 33604]|uniref:PH domain-containing protein n=1 Tax=Jaapia argillacea MUCL 33604 TaxID=933084 RepID=A0A067Q0P9_9AGAM|nr:hypothetical protein JAAARDRAFT_178587 [Jaapia argillacea MUCL 33604]